MKNRGLLTRQGLAAIGGHKVLEAAAAPVPSPKVQPTTGQPTPVESARTNNPDTGLLPQESIQPETSLVAPRPKRQSQVHTKEKAKPPSVKRYTLILKITPDLRDRLDALIGPDAPVRRRLIMAAFSQSLKDVSVSADMVNPPHPAISWRLDLRLEDALVQTICAQSGRSYEPVAAILARFIAPKLASFIEERVPSQQVTHQQPESQRLD